MVREAQEDGPFGAQPGEFQNDAAGVAEGALLPQPSAHGRLQQGEPGAVGPGGGQCRRHRDVGDAGGMHGLGNQDGETHLERVDAGVDLLERLRIRFVQADAVAFELLDGQADEAGGLSIDDGAVGVARGLPLRGLGHELVERLEASVETGVEVIGVGVGRQLGGQGLLELIEVRAVGGGGQSVQHRQRPLQQLAGSLQRVDGVGDRGCVLVGGDRLPLLALSNHPGTDGRFDVGVVHGCEAGQAEIERPWLGEDVRLREVGAVGGLAHGPIVPCTDGLLVHNRPSILGLWSHWA